MVLKILLMVLISVIGIICINNPILIAKMVTVSTSPLYKLMTMQRTESKVHEAFYLLNTDTDKYQKVFHFQMSIIRLTGYTALLVSITGTCILLLGN
jgi:hypothetical protein